MNTLIASNSANRKARGFSLIEIMMVVMILGMLLAVAIPKFLNARQGSNARTCQSNLKNILSAKERWAMDNNEGADAVPLMANLVKDYLKLDPVCPGGGDYIVDRMNRLPTCTVGGVKGEFKAHVLP